MSALGKAIKAERQARGWSQKEFAARAKALGLKLNYQTVGAVENGRFASTYRTNEICQVLGVSLDELLRQATEALASQGLPPMPDIADLTAILMDIRGIDENELATAMKVTREDVDDLLAGAAGPQLWGAAAVALGVEPLAYDIASLDGLEAALRHLGIPRYVDRPIEYRQPGG
jgi:transcriptional regulator with XRE-family HTH domain